MVKKRCFFSQFFGSLDSKVGAFNQGWTSTSTASTPRHVPNNLNLGLVKVPPLLGPKWPLPLMVMLLQVGKEPPQRWAKVTKRRRGSEVEKRATWGVCWCQVLKNDGVIELETVAKELWQLSFSRHANCIEWLWFQFLLAKLSLRVRSFWSYITRILRRISNCDCLTFLNGHHIHIPKDLMYLAGVLQHMKHGI